MLNKPDYDSEKYEICQVSIDEVNLREPSLKATGWFRASGFEIIEEDIGACFYVRERLHYNPPSDKIKECRTCRKPFTFSVYEQDFSRRNGLMEPETCLDCRTKYQE